MKLLISGLSTRAIATSALRSGCDFITLDYFGDRDQKEEVENYSLSRDFQTGFSSKNLLEASRRLDFEGLVYISNLENDPKMVDRMAQGHKLLGNSPQTLRQVRNVNTLRSFFQNGNMKFPATILTDEALPKGSVHWLCKVAKSGGGHRITSWKGEAPAGGQYLQEYIDGIPCSASFVANGKDCRLIGISEQLIGENRLGAHGFSWCGNIFPLSLPPEVLHPLMDMIRAAAEMLTRSFNLKGLNGFDFVLYTHKSSFTPYLLEVNPRYTASMELIERAVGLNLFQAHVRSFGGELPSFSLAGNLSGLPFYAKGIVYAEKDALIPDTFGWKAKGRRDIPFPGERILKRHPICTVFARGENRGECWRRLLQEADAVRKEIDEG